MCLSSAVGLWWSPAWLQVVKPLEKFGPFTSGGQMNSLKQKKPSKLIYFKCKFDANLFYVFKNKIF